MSDEEISVDALSEFDPTPYLGSAASIAAYLTDIMETNDAALLAATLGNIAKARGMADIVRSSGLTREALYKALKADAHPRFETIARVCGALGVKLVAQVI